MNTHGNAVPILCKNHLRDNICFYRARAAAGHTKARYKMGVPCPHRIGCGTRWIGIPFSFRSKICKSTKCITNIAKINIINISIVNININITVLLQVRYNVVLINCHPSSLLLLLSSVHKFSVIIIVIFFHSIVFKLIIHYLLLKSPTCRASLTWRPRTSNETRPRLPAPRATRPALLTYSALCYRNVDVRF